MSYERKRRTYRVTRCLECGNPFAVVVSSHRTSCHGCAPIEQVKGSHNWRKRKARIAAKKVG